MKKILKMTVSFCILLLSVNQFQNISADEENLDENQITEVSELESADESTSNKDDFDFKDENNDIMYEHDNEPQENIENSIDDNELPEDETQESKSVEESNNVEVLNQDIDTNKEIEDEIDPDENLSFVVSNYDEFKDAFENPSTTEILIDTESVNESNGYQAVTRSTDDQAIVITSPVKREQGENLRIRSKNSSSSTIRASIEKSNTLQYYDTLLEFNNSNVIFEDITFENYYGSYSIADSIAKFINSDVQFKNSEVIEILVQPFDKDLDRTYPSKIFVSNNSSFRLELTHKFEIEMAPGTFKEIDNYDTATLLYGTVSGPVIIDSLVYNLNRLHKVGNINIQSRKPSTAKPIINILGSDTNELELDIRGSIVVDNIINSYRYQIDDELKNKTDLFLKEYTEFVSEKLKNAVFIDVSQGDIDKIIFKENVQSRTSLLVNGGYAFANLGKAEIEFEMGIGEFSSRLSISTPYFLMVDEDKMDSFNLKASSTLENKVENTRQYEITSYYPPALELVELNEEEHNTFDIGLKTRIIDPKTNVKNLFIRNIKLEDQSGPFSRSRNGYAVAIGDLFGGEPEETLLENMNNIVGGIDLKELHLDNSSIITREIFDFGTYRRYDSQPDFTNFRRSIRNNEELELLSLKNNSEIMISPISKGMLNSGMVLYFQDSFLKTERLELDNSKLEVAPLSSRGVSGHVHFANLVEINGSNSHDNLIMTNNSKLIIKDNSRRDNKFENHFQPNGNLSNDIALLSSRNESSGQVINLEGDIELESSNNPDWIAFKEVSTYPVTYHFGNNAQFSSNVSSSNHAIKHASKELNITLPEGGLTEINITGKDFKESAVKLDSQDTKITIGDGDHAINIEDTGSDVSNPLLDFVGKMKVEHRNEDTSEKSAKLTLKNQLGPILDNDQSSFEFDLDDNFVSSMVGNVPSGHIFVTDDFNYKSNNNSSLILENSASENASVLKTNSAKLEIVKSRIDLWKSGEAFGKDAPYSFLENELKLSGEKLGTVIESSDYFKKNYDKDFGMTDNARIEVGYFNPVVHGIKKISNADKNVYIKAIIETDKLLDKSRPAKSGELSFKVLELNEKGEVVETYDDIEIIDPKSAGYDKIKIYSELTNEIIEDADTKAGHARIELPDYADESHTFKVEEVKLHTGDSITLEEGEKEIGTETYNIEQAVIDQTPPKPSEVSNIFLESTSFTGKTSEKGKLSIYRESTDEEGIVSNVKIVDSHEVEGTWSLPIPDSVKNLTEGEVFIFVLEDENGNKNPFEDEKWRDATFDKATEIKVKNNPYDVSGRNYYTTIEKLSDVSNLQDFVLDSLKINVKLKENDTVVTNIAIENSSKLDLNNPTPGIYTFGVKIEETDVILKTFDLLVLEQDQIIFDEESDILIASNNFYGDRNTHKLEDKKIIEKANAISYDLSNMKSSKVSIKNNTIESKPGKYKVIFSNYDNAEVTVQSNANILDFDHVSETDETVIGANDFRAYLYEVNDHNDLDDFVTKKSNASGFSKNKNGTLKKEEIEVLENEVKREIGKGYKVKFKVVLKQAI